MINSANCTTERVTDSVFLDVLLNKLEAMLDQVSVHVMGVMSWTNRVALNQCLNCVAVRRIDCVI